MSLIIKNQARKFSRSLEVPGSWYRQKFLPLSKSVTVGDVCMKLGCDFGALLLLPSMPLAHKGIARPTPRVWDTRVGDTGSNGLVTCIGCGAWVAGKPENKIIGAS